MNYRVVVPLASIKADKETWRQIIKHHLSKGAQVVIQPVMGAKMRAVKLRQVKGKCSESPDS